MSCKEREGLALACGPMPFLRFIWRYALEIGLRTQLSLEQPMACGVGACLGCVAGRFATLGRCRKGRAARANLHQRSRILGHGRRP